VERDELSNHYYITCVGCDEDICADQCQGQYCHACNACDMNEACNDCFTRKHEYKCQDCIENQVEHICDKTCHPRK